MPFVISSGQNFWPGGGDSGEPRVDGGGRLETPQLAERDEEFHHDLFSDGRQRDFVLPQNWDNQDVLQLGLAYKPMTALTLRMSASFSDNPVPDSTLNSLFPAIEKNHYMAGFGYAINDSSSIDFSLQHAPKVEPANSTFGYTVSHSQTNWQLMYSKAF